MCLFRFLQFFGTIPAEFSLWRNGRVPQSVYFFEVIVFTKISLDILLARLATADPRTERIAHDLLPAGATISPKIWRQAADGRRYDRHREFRQLPI